MEHLLEVLKILDGALSADHSKVVAYAIQLAAKLEAKGDSRSAQGIRRTVSSERKGSNLTTARLAPLLPVDSESRLALADEQFFLPENVQIVLEPNSCERVAEFIRHIRASDELLAQGVGISPSMLVYGPPGCGKTELAKHISAELQLPLLTARADSLISSYLGSTSKNIRVLFEHAMSRPCVLFLDEFDSIAKLRDDRHELGELKRVVVGLLQNIDALDSKTVLVAATNHEHLLDRAIWRRFAFHMQVGLPILESRKLLLKQFLAAQMPSGLEIENLAQATEGLSGAEIKQLCERVRRNAILDRRVEVDEAELLLQIARCRIVALENLPLRQKLLETRALSSKLYSIRRLASMFSVSTGKISTLLRSEEKEQEDE